MVYSGGMYLELKSDTVEPILNALRERLESGVSASASFAKKGDFFSVSINTATDEPALPT